MRLLLAAVAMAWSGACTEGPDLPEPAGPASGGPGYIVAARPQCDGKLTAAVEAGDDATVRTLVTGGVHSSCAVETQVAMTALDRAVIDDRVEIVRALLEGGADPNLRWSSHGDRFPLQQAIESASYGLRPRHRTEIVALLLRHGADPDASWCQFESRVPIYAPGGRQILQPGCTAATGVTPLRIAVELDQVDTVALLLHAGAKAGEVDRHNATALDLSRSTQVYGLLVAQQFGSEASAIADYQRRHPSMSSALQPGDTVLTAAVAGRLYGFTRLELATGADPDRASAATAGGVTPLALAVSMGWSAGAELLLDSGADIEARSCPTPTWVATYLQRPLDVSGCTLERGLTPLMMAAIAKQPVGVFGRNRAFELQNATVVDWRGRSARRHAQLAGVAPELLATYGR